MKVALVYDRVNKWGGAERVLLALHEMFPDAPLYTSVYDAVRAPWARVFDVRPSFLQYFPFAQNNHEWYASWMPIVFESFSFDEYELVISITSEAAKGIITKPQTKHVCVCLTPTRYLWSGYQDYFQNIFLKILSFPLISYLRLWDKIASKRPDTYIAISQEVKKRIKEYYKKDSTVIYPATTISLNHKEKPKEVGYFLIVSRLVPYKKIDLAVKACSTYNLPLKIIGTGSQLSYLKSIAGPTVEFLGSLTDEEVVRYYNGCCATIFPGIEDLGLTVLEAHQFGKPVIAFAGGGALETVEAGKTGEFFFPQTSSALGDKLQMLIKSKKIEIGKTESMYTPYCLQHAKQFGKEQFEKDLRSFLKKIL